MSNGSNHDHGGERGAERVKLQHRNRCGGCVDHRRAVGAINPASDLTTGWRTSIIGVATSASVIRLNIFNSDTAN
jgi:hypothetical protein